MTEELEAVRLALGERRALDWATAYALAPLAVAAIVLALHVDERLDAREPGNLGKPLQAGVPEPPVDELVARVNLPGLGDTDRGAVSIFRADAVGLEQDRAAIHRPPTQHAQQPSGFWTLCRMPKQ